MLHPCKLCGFPTPDHDRLPLKTGGEAHATCAFEATRRLGAKSALLLKRRINHATQRRTR